LAFGTDRRCPNPGTGSPAGIYRPRRTQSSPLYRLLQEHFEEVARTYEERFAHRYGPWRQLSVWQC